MIIIANKAEPGLAGAIILWHGLASALPSGWEIYSAAKDVYVCGAQDIAGIVTTPAGSHNHTHTNPNTGADGVHNHTASVGTVSGSSSVDAGYSTSGSDMAQAGHVHNSKSASLTNCATHTHPVPDTDSKTHLPPSKKLYWIKWVSGSAIPIGAITMWSNIEADIPTSWDMCDGTGGTLDLTSKFIYGANIDADVGDAIGAATHNHSIASLASGGAHTHPVTGSLNSPASASYPNGFAAGVNDGAPASHSHSHSGTSGSSGAHVHPTSDNVAIASIPPAIELYFIQKVS